MASEWIEVTEDHEKVYVQVCHLVKVRRTRNNANTAVLELSNGSGIHCEESPEHVMELIKQRKSL